MYVHAWEPLSQLAVGDAAAVPNWIEPTTRTDSSAKTHQARNTRPPCDPYPSDAQGTPVCVLRREECSLFAAVAGLSQADGPLPAVIDRLLRFVVLPISCIVAAGSPLASASSGHDVSSAGAGSQPVTMRAGDQIVVTGSRLRCAVSTASSASHPPTLVCGVGDVQSPLPGTYAFAIADKAALVIKSSATRQPELVLEEAEPTAKGTFQIASGRAAATLKVSPGAILLVGGSDILCAVSSQAGTPTLTCGLAAGGAGTFIIGSYVGVISERLALLSKLLSSDKFVTVFSKTQPAR